MKNLWAPWRLEFLKAPKTDGQCPFCELPTKKDDRENLILYRSEHAFIILNRYPYNNGHLLVVPYAHESDYALLSEKTLLDLMRLKQKAIRCLESCYKPNGFNLGMNLGVAGGAGIPGHLHYHIIPRWMGDTNFMAIVDQTKLINEHLMESYDRMKKLI